MPPTEKKAEKKTPEDLSEFLKEEFGCDVNSNWDYDQADDLRKFGKIILGSLLNLQERLEELERRAGIPPAGGAAK